MRVIIPDGKDVARGYSGFRTARTMREIIPDGMDGARVVIPDGKDDAVSGIPSPLSKRRWAPHGIAQGGISVDPPWLGDYCTLFPPSRLGGYSNFSAGRPLQQWPLVKGEL